MLFEGKKPSQTVLPSKLNHKQVSTWFWRQKTSKCGHIAFKFSGKWMRKVDVHYICILGRHIDIQTHYGEGGCNGTTIVMLLV